MKILLMFFQHGPSKPDEIFGGGSNGSEIIILVIVSIVLLLFLISYVANFFTPSKTSEEMLINYSKEVDLSQQYDLLKMNRNDVIIRIFEQYEKHSYNYNTYNKTVLRDKLEILSDDDVRKVYFRLKD